MSYLREVQDQVKRRNFPKLLQLWEEYCRGDSIDVEELVPILEAIERSDLAEGFGPYVEQILPLWEQLEDREDAFRVLRGIVNVQTTQSDMLFRLSKHMLEEKYGQCEDYPQWIRFLGFHEGEPFTGVLAKCEMLAHLKKGNFIFHSGGWGTGEIIDVSPIRQEMVVDFERLSAPKGVAFTHVFNYLRPLPESHFLARRFGDPDALEQQARSEPLEVLKDLLRDLGPLSAADMKEELHDLVIPEEDWTKWWQLARAKLKRDPMIEVPSSSKGPFVLRREEVSPLRQFVLDWESLRQPIERLRLCYSFARDFPGISKEEEGQEFLKEKVFSLLAEGEPSPEFTLQASLFLEQFVSHVGEKSAQDQITECADVEAVVNACGVVALKKMALEAIKEHRSDWQDLFLSLLFSVEQSQLREFLFREVNQAEGQEGLLDRLGKLLAHPEQNPEMVLWYFGKITKGTSSSLPYGDREGQGLFFEALLILFQKLENQTEWQAFLKQLYQLFTANHYERVRELFADSSLEFTQECLLLVAKCHLFSDHEKKVFNSLAQVAHPSLKAVRDGTKKQLDASIIWTTEEGLRKAEERVRHIGTVEIVNNAEEIKVARAHGDLRENAEYKSALERRSHLQSELKLLSDQLRRARVLSEQDLSSEEVGVGSIVEVVDTEGSSNTYTILGPWEADPEKNIVSFQSQLAQTMMSLKQGDRFQFRDREYQVAQLRSYLD